VTPAIATTAPDGTLTGFDARAGRDGLDTLIAG
jgi:hypothetical protein